MSLLRHVLPLFTKYSVLQVEMHEEPLLPSRRSKCPTSSQALLTASCAAGPSASGTLVASLLHRHLGRNYATRLASQPRSSLAPTGGRGFGSLGNHMLGVVRGIGLREVLRARFVSIRIFAMAIQQERLDEEGGQTADL